MHMNQEHHGMSETAEYRAFRDALNRCTNPTLECWNNYGGRGIRFLFTSFEQFFAELGPRPEGMTLDRKNNDGNYEPGNVRWATWEEQQNNRRQPPSKLKFTKRTVVLLEPEIYAAISERAQRSGLSIGELVRRAIKQ